MGRADRNFRHYITRLSISLTRPVWGVRIETCKSAMMLSFSVDAPRMGRADRNTAEWEKWNREIGRAPYGACGSKLYPLTDEEKKTATRPVWGVRIETCGRNNSARFSPDAPRMGRADRNAANEQINADTDLTRPVWGVRIETINCYGKRALISDAPRMGRADRNR